jgi:hypothetical protein
VVSDPGNPTTNLTSTQGTTFQVNVKQLTEYNIMGEVVKAVNFSTLALNLVQSDYVDDNNVSLHNWTYSGPLPGLGNGMFTLFFIILN